MNKEDNDIKKEITNAFSTIGQVGIRCFSCIFICFLLGRFIDKLLGTTPAVIVVFCLIGMAASLKIIVDLAYKDLK